MENAPEVISVIIAEDDAILRQALELHLRSFPRVQVLAAVASGEEAVEMASKRPPMAIFLDIRMPGKDGLSVAARLRDIHPAICLVFVTGHTEYAAVAYQLDAVDYLVKPVSRDGIARALRRIERRSSQSGKAFSTNDMLLVKNNHQVYFLHQGDIIFLEKLSRKTIIHTEDGEYITTETLQALEEKLNQDFFRCHKSFMVNITKIQRISPMGDRLYEVSFHKSNGKVTMGRKAFEQLCGIMNRTDAGADTGR
ncbi:MAG TPA: LytTR family DNA-binding domain-containing protein [Syntrophomonadaceae bacterium]|nr:LytTR family DNA-binding domain-containing protein [Syntrophomonadaceae bacterium]